MSDAAWWLGGTVAVIGLALGCWVLGRWFVAVANAVLAWVHGERGE